MNSAYTRYRVSWIWIGCKIDYYLQVCLLHHSLRAKKINKDENVDIGHIVLKLVSFLFYFEFAFSLNQTGLWVRLFLPKVKHTSAYDQFGSELNRSINSSDDSLGHSNDNPNRLNSSFTPWTLLFICLKNTNIYNTIFTKLK